MSESFYKSAWHLPGIAWLGLLVVGVAVWRRKPPLAAWWLAMAVVAAVDALFAGALSPLAAGPWATFASVVFVVVGDWRFLFLILRDRHTGRRAALYSLAWALLVPTLAHLLSRGIPSLFPTQRQLFLAYELLFCALCLGLLMWLRSQVGVRHKRWLMRLACFELVQYGLWVIADVLILAEHRALGLALRVVPNALYYAAFPLVAMWLFPSQEQAR